MMTPERLVEIKARAEARPKLMSWGIEDDIANRGEEDRRKDEAALIAEIERLRKSEADKWEADHQRTHLEALGLAEEYPWGCDAIRMVAEDLIAARAEVERLRTELDAWTNYFGCDSPHDTDVMAETALGKEQARANRLEHELRERCEYLKEMKDFFPLDLAGERECPTCDSWSDRAPIHAPNCRHARLMKMPEVEPVSNKVSISFNGTDISAHVERLKIGVSRRKYAIAHEVTIEFREGGTGEPATPNDLAAWPGPGPIYQGIRPPNIGSDVLFEMGGGLLTFRSALMAAEIWTRSGNYLRKIKLVTREVI